MALIKKYTFFKFLFFIIYFFLPPFRHPPRMMVPPAFAYTAYAQGWLWNKLLALWG